MNTVCIVDDYDINLFILKEYLEGSYVTKSFDNAKDCLAYVEKNKVDLILMDCNMPIMDGFTATKILKAKNKKVKVIGVTSTSFEMDIKKCYDSGMDKVLVKPIFKEDLLKAINFFQ